MLTVGLPCSSPSSVKAHDWFQKLIITGTAVLLYSIVLLEIRNNDCDIKR